MSVCHCVDLPAVSMSAPFGLCKPASDWMATKVPCYQHRKIKGLLTAVRSRPLGLRVAHSNGTLSELIRQFEVRRGLDNLFSSYPGFSRLFFGIKEILNKKRQKKKKKKKN